MPDPKISVARRIAVLTGLLAILSIGSTHAADCSNTSTGNTPLYPSIFVPRTAQEQSAGLAAANSIPSGRTVLLSIGMSNAKGLWDRFVRDAEADPLKRADLEVVNGAQSGGATSGWATPGAEKTWGELDESLSNAGVTRNDVSVIWFVTHNAVSHQTVEDYATGLERDARDALDLFAIEFPNLKIVWLQPMIYAGYSTASGNSEPHAYESGAVVQRLLVGQNWPFFVGYGPYTWADGVVPRDDGLTWLCSDFKEDGNHPEIGAKTKHSDMLLQFFHEDSVASIGYLGTVTLLTVPDVVGLEQAVAESVIVSAGLAVGSVSMANSNSVPAGNVISQDPAGGSSAAAGTPVDLTVSLGPAVQVIVPDVVGLDQAGAESAIESALLVVGTVSTVSSDSVPAGNVISQSPSGGSTVTSGTSVDLTVSLGSAAGMPRMIAPPDGSTLSGSSETFVWSAEGESVTNWRLEIGTTPGGRDVYRANFTPDVTSQLVSGLPTDGSTLYVTLKWRTDGASSSASYVYTASGDGPPPTGTPSITSPAPGSTLSGAAETFTWSAGTTAVSRWRLEVGTVPDGTDILVQGMDAAVTSTLVSGLPTDGSPVYVNLRWRSGGVSSVASYTFTAAGGSP